MPFSSLPSILSLFSQQLPRLFIQGWTLSCRFCSGPVITICILLVVVLLVIFTPSCCSYCHCLACSNSHTVVLSKPASYSPAFFSVPIKRCEHAYQSFMVVYGTGKVRRLCGYSTLAGAVKVRLRYGRRTRKVRRTYG